MKKLSIQVVLLLFVFNHSLQVFADVSANQFFKYDPDQDRTTCQIVTSRGFLCETQIVTTYQGYKIELHRIPPFSLSSEKKPVILQTGLIGTSADFVMATDNVSLNTSVTGQNMAIELAKWGYDVWMANNRGSKYGQAHVSLKPTDKEFWDFSFDEISQFDTPAIIDFVRNKTNADKIHFIGHSQGSAVLFALLSQTEKFNQAVASFTAISPITRIGDAKTAFRLLIASIRPILIAQGGPVFTANFVSTGLVPLACDFAPSRFFCELVFFAICGPDFEQLNLSRMAVYMAHQPTSTSAKNLLHFHQLFKSNEFKKYDYGTMENLIHYGQKDAPMYSLRNITHPSVYVIYSLNDWFVPISGVDALKNDLSKAKEFFQVSNKRANHMDPLIGKDVAVEVNMKVLNILQQND